MTEEKDSNEMEEETGSRDGGNEKDSKETSDLEDILNELKES